ncbi:hypothetical protein MBLNU459_g6330t1 [Dothideomycetes sp. NU459]
MARASISVALTAACLALVATLFSIYQFGLPELDYWHWKAAGLGLSATNGQQVLDDPAVPSWASTGGAGHQYLLGVGRADVTGPVVEINLMGYADPNQLGTGLRQRLYSRAFIIGDRDNELERFVYLVLDTQSGDTAVRNGILEGLKALGPEYAVYGNQNVAVTGTHSHSGPGAWLNYLLPQITSRGFSKQSYEAIVQGAIASIREAHRSLAPGRLEFGSIEIPDANINRSPFAYLANPPSERERYEHDVDKHLTMLKFRRENDGKNVGVLTWFPVHGTSMLGNNTLITGDNKGVAAYLFEQYAKDQDNTAEGFVAGFSQANVGDTSPNVLGAFCESGDDRGQQCDFKTSLCAGKTGPCHGRGPHWGLDDAGTASAWEIGRRQFVGARSLYESMDSGSAGDDASATHQSITGKTVRSLHTYVDFANRKFTLRNGTHAQTCPAALGYSFAAGTTDGPGAFDFKQNNPGDPKTSPVWAVVRNSLHKPGPEQIACHGVKPILLDVGETESPYLWSPNYVDIQLLRVGQLVIIVSPGEATTMAGRRWKEALASEAANAWSNSDSSPLVVLGGPANTYTHYIATAEEYDVQRYEGASTMYGPHTLESYIELTVARLPYLDSSSETQPDASLPPKHPSLPTLDPGPSPPIYTNTSLSFIRGVIVDNAPLFRSFGDVSDDVSPRYAISAAPSVSATFVGANPRNNLRLDGTFAAVEKYDVDRSAWVVVKDDKDWDLVYEWERTSTVVGTSAVKITWETGWDLGVWQGDGLSESAAESRTAQSLRGRYRLRYFGDAKSLGGTLTPFEGMSGEFDLV